jgi:hypothetical protein
MAAVRLVLFLCVASCAASTDFCRQDEDCAPGLCVDGVCRQPVGAGSDGGAAQDLALVPHDLLLPPIPDGWSPDALAASCKLNNDGTITRSEAPFMVGLGGLFAVNPAGTTVSVTTTPSTSGWDYSAAQSGDEKFFSELQSPTGNWWSSDFPTATYAEFSDSSASTLGVYRATATSLELLGLVSTQNGLTATELTYATPIPVLQFPLSVGSTWTASSGVSGLAQGVGFAANETWTFTVESRHTTKVPAGSFDTLRLRIDYRQTYGFLVTTRITYIHLAECYGAVARLRSLDNETSGNFTQAAEYRRLSTP